MEYKERIWYCLHVNLSINLCIHVPIKFKISAAYLKRRKEKELKKILYCLWVKV